MAKTYITRSLRISSEEEDVLRRASRLLGQPTSQLVQAGVAEAAHRLGFYIDVVSLPKPYAGLWPDLPDRRGVAASVRTSVILDPQTAALLTRAANYVGVHELKFLLGATFRYLVGLRRVDPRLRRLLLPAQYEDS